MKKHVKIIIGCVIGICITALAVIGVINWRFIAPLGVKSNPEGETATETPVIKYDASASADYILENTITEGIPVGNTKNGKTQILPDYSEYLILPDYESMDFAIDTETIDYTDDEIATYAKYDTIRTFEDSIEYEELSSGTIEQFDRLEADWTATWEDTKTVVKGLSDESNNHMINTYDENIGDGTEDQLIGKDIDKPITVTTKAYHIDGEQPIEAEVTSTITVHKILRPKFDSITDEMVQKNTDCATVEEYNKKTTDAIRTSVNEQKYAMALDEILNVIYNNTKFKKWPKDELEQIKAITYDEDIGDKKVNEEYAKKALGLKMITYEIAKKEGVEVTDNDMTDYAKAHSVELNTDEDKRDIMYLLTRERIEPILVAKCQRIK